MVLDRDGYSCQSKSHDVFVLVIFFLNATTMEMEEEVLETGSSLWSIKPYILMLCASVPR